MVPRQFSLRSVFLVTAVVAVVLATKPNILLAALLVLGGLCNVFRTEDAINTSQKYVPKGLKVPVRREFVQIAGCTALALGVATLIVAIFFAA